MFLIVGLGNPGKEYEKARHNTGFIVLDNILGKIDWKESSKVQTLFHKGFINKKEIEYLKPQTFMNNSGGAVFYAKEKHKIKTQNIIIIYDDLDLSIGSMKISFNKSSGGHKGLESIIKKLKSPEFVRLRIGISPISPSGKIRKPKGEEKIIKFILGSYKEDELKTLKKLSKKVAEAIEMIVSEGHSKAMSLYN